MSESTVSRCRMLCAAVLACTPAQDDPPTLLPPHLTARQSTPRIEREGGDSWTKLRRGSGGCW
eukprot:2179870-Rhodomonas_salina.2